MSYPGYPNSNPPSMGYSGMPNSTAPSSMYGGMPNTAPSSMYSGMPNSTAPAAMYGGMPNTAPSMGYPAAPAAMYGGAPAAMYGGMPPAAPSMGYSAMQTSSTPYGYSGMPNSTAPAAMYGGMPAGAARPMNAPAHMSHSHCGWEGHGHYYVIRSEHNPHLVLDIDGASRSGGAKLIVWEPNGQANQRWKINDTFIESENSGLVLDVDGGVHQGNHIIQFQRKHHGADNQKWTYDPMTQCIKLVNHPHLVLDIKGGSRDRGAHVICWQYNGQSNQRWRLERHHRR